MFKRFLLNDNSLSYSDIRPNSTTILLLSSQIIILILGLETLVETLEDASTPELFTLGELQQVYEIILDKKLLDPAFRRIIADKVEKTDKMKTLKHYLSLLSVLFLISLVS